MASQSNYEHVTNPQGAGGGGKVIRLRVPWPNFRRPRSAKPAGRRHRRPRERFLWFSWRVALVAFLLMLTLVAGIFIGARVFARRPPTPPATSAVAAHQPEANFAWRFTFVYLTYNGDKSDDWRNLVSTYAADGTDIAKWDGKGKQAIVQAAPQQVEVLSGGRAIVTVSAQTDDGRWLYLAVPVVRDQLGNMAVFAQPAFVPPPDKAAYQADSTPAEEDSTLETQLRGDMQAFLKAYASGSPSELGFYAASGSHLTGLKGMVRFPDDGLQTLNVEQGLADERNATVVVRWKVGSDGTDLGKPSGASFVQTYRLRLVLEGGKWRVASVALKDS